MYWCGSAASLTGSPSRRALIRLASKTLSYRVGPSLGTAWHLANPLKASLRPPARGTVQESAGNAIIAIPLSEILYCQYTMFQDCHFVVHPALH